MKKIEALRKKLREKPTDPKIRSKLLQELIFSEIEYIDEAKQSIIWFIKNKPDYLGQWVDWRVCFTDWAEFKGLVELWQENVLNNPSLQVLKNAAQFTAGMDSEFSIRCLRDILKLTPNDHSLKEDLALALFYKDTKSKEALQFFVELYSLNSLTSVFTLSVGAISAFETNDHLNFNKWTEELNSLIANKSSELMSEELYPGYSALLLKSVFNRNLDEISNFLKKLVRLEQFNFSNFVIFDERTIKALIDFGYVSQAKNYAETILAATKDEEITKLVSNLLPD